MARRSDPTPPLTLQTPEFTAAWATWMKHLREKCGKVTAGQVAAQGEKCAFMGSERAIAAIQFSIERGYRSIYEPTQSITAVKQEAAKSMNDRIVADGRKYRQDAEDNKATFDAECEAAETWLRECDAKVVHEFAMSLPSPFGGAMPMNWSAKPLLRNWVHMQWKARKP